MVYEVAWWWWGEYQTHHYQPQPIHSWLSILTPTEDAVLVLASCVSSPGFTQVRVLGSYASVECPSFTLVSGAGPGFTFALVQVLDSTWRKVQVLESPWR